MNDALARNIPRHYLFTLLGNIDLTRGLWMIFLASRGFSLVQLGLLEGLFHLTSLSAEVPTGAVADLWGRKISRAAGRLFFLASLVLMFAGRTFAVQALAFILIALGYNLESGSGEALVYDSLKALGRSDGFSRVAGRTELVYQTAMVVSLLAGGRLATRQGWEPVFLITGLFGALAFAAALSLREPPRDDDGEGAAGTGDEAPRGNILVRQMTDSVRILRDSPRVALVILATELLLCYTTTMFFYLQNFWKGRGLTEEVIGWILAANCLGSGLAGALAHRLMKRSSHGVLMAALAAFVLAGLWAIALSPWRMAAYILLGPAEGVLFIATQDYVNKRIPSRYRATILSLQSMSFSLMMIALFPVIGWLAQGSGFAAAFVAMAGSATVLALGAAAAQIHRRRRS